MTPEDYAGNRYVPSVATGSVGIRLDSSPLAVTCELCDGWGRRLALGQSAQRQKEREVCICAAVIDPVSAEIIRGHRHAGIMAQIWSHHDPSPRIKHEHQGFITSHNRFVNREEGLRLQKAAGIASAETERGYLETQLTSEDLYGGTY